MSLTSAFSWLRPAPMETSVVPAHDAPARARLPGPDVTRAVALIGVVVMNYHGYLNGGAAASDTGSTFFQSLFDPWQGVLSTRFASTFVLVAGIGVTLLTNRSRTSGAIDAIRLDRWRLARRGFVLYAFGFVLDWVWPGTILFYYGALFMLAAALFTLRTRWLLAIAAAAALGAAGLAWWGAVRLRDGDPVDWLFAPDTLETRSPRGLLFDTFVNGTHPLLPWLAFFCIGIAIGRTLPALPRARLVLTGALMTATAYALGTVLRRGDDPVRAIVFSTRPFDRGLLYTVSTAGTAIVAFCAISWVAERCASTRPIRVLSAAGGLTLTLYVLHVVVFRALVDVADLIRPTGLDTALTFAGVFWIVAIAFAAAWTRWFGIGPVERLYRRLGG